MQIFEKKPTSRIVCALILLFMPALPLLAYDVTVGGHSMGIILKSDGAIVVGFTPVKAEGGEEVYPAKAAGVQLEDKLLAINGHTVVSNQEVAEQVNKSDGAELILTVRRGEEEMEIPVTPQLCAESGQYRLGLYIRDANAGIGTLTFYDPATGKFAALGHKIDEPSGGAGGNIGRVLAADVQYVESSRDGQPGEKVGVFDDKSLRGTIAENCNLGLYGTLEEPVRNEIYTEPVPVAEVDEVHTGEATILTVLSGEQVEEFAIEIERVMPQRKAADKGMVIKITDERLLAAAGGIVQGMSGSPIIQDGKLVGAVTHVFVNDGSSGYGCFAEWMLEEAQNI